MSRKIWIDLTDMSVWSGHLTGIQRVVYNVAKNYNQSGDEVRFFIFNDRDNTFHEYSFLAIQDRVEPPIAETVAISQAATSSRASAKQFVLRSYQKSPQWVKDKMTPARKEKARKLYGKARHKAVSLKHRTVARSSYGPEIQFGREDTVLIMGKPWDYPTFMETIRQQKIKKGFTLVQVVYDLIPTFFPQLFGEQLFKPYTNHMFEVVANSDLLLAISKSTKNDVIKFSDDMKLPKPNVEVIRLGDDIIQDTQPQKPEGVDIKTGNYILSVGTIEVRKNHALLYSAYKEGLARGIKMPKLVIVGSPGWYTGDVLYEFTHDPQLKELVYIMHNTSDSELLWLYQNCLFTVYPSVYEGWGLPIAESLAYGKICVASHAASMTEIAGDLLEYFSPYDSAQCLKLIQKYLDKDVRNKKELEIKKKFEVSTWLKTYEQVKTSIDKL